jgi:hypothetical protein
MKKMSELTAILVLAALMAAPVFADTLVLKSGERVSGYFEGGSARVVKFRTSDGVVKDYDILSVQTIQFGDAATASSAPASAPSTSTRLAPTTNTATNTTTTPAAAPQLRPSTERPPAQPTSGAAANTAYTIPTGTKVTIRLIDSVSSEKQKIGDPFVAVLEEPVLYNGTEVVAKGADVRGRIANANDAGRLTGKAELGLELTQIIVNGIPYSVTTSEYSEVGESRTGQTAKRAGIGAGIGAAIGAIAGGGKGAAIGAGVGGGGATAVQVLTKGEKLNIPSETKLEFTLRSPLVVAAK